MSFSTKFVRGVCVAVGLIGAACWSGLVLAQEAATVRVATYNTSLFRNESGEPASILLLFTPGAPREPYFETLAEAAAGRRLSRDEFARWDDRYGSNYPGERFADLDRNNNGSIARNEWNGDSAAFDRLDTNRNGRLSRDEFARWDDRDNRNVRFANLDRNNNGSIARSEWNGDRASFDRLDTNRDGQLSRDEFFRMSGF